jgi:hypothetical protein
VGHYNAQVHFRETQQHNLYAIQAKKFMCQRCLMQSDAADLLCVDPLRTALAIRQREIAATDIPENDLPM